MSISLIHIINGLFGTGHSPSAGLEYLSAEHITGTLKQCIGDILISINGKYKYLIEAQMSDDEDMALRIFNYSYLEGLKTKAAAGEDTGQADTGGGYLSGIRFRHAWRTISGNNGTG
ncbi:MAG: hypothetical protein LBD55_08900 [Treponema sp.]|jgi:hypothetical protein|nr:hypothetical protein [Treponema sp.]